MIKLECGGDLTELRIRTFEGLNLTAFLDHLSVCEQCRTSEKELITQLNKLIGSES